MKLWLRRLLYTLAVVFWLLVMSFPTIAFLLATQQELQIGSSDRNHVRLFLLEDADAQGVGIEWARDVRQQPQCSRTSIRYILWEGEAPPIRYCQCYDEISGEPLPQNLFTCN